MKRQDLLKMMDNELLDKLYGFCYSRTGDSHEAQELCSDVIFALVKAANAEGEIVDVYPFIWRIARNIYADFCEKRRRNEETIYQGDTEEVFLFLAAEEEEKDDSQEMLKAVYRQISFLTKAYREVMILFYLEGLSTAEIAKQLNASEVAVRQRLFAARKKVKSEVEDIMAEISRKPVALETMYYDIWGNGDPFWSDPRSVCTRQFSRHIIWLCRKKAMSAAEIADMLNVPTVYVEEEMEILTKGDNGKYGLLKRLESGKYITNFILLDKEEIRKAHEIYRKEIPKACEIIGNYIEQHKEEYLSFPYLNKKVDLNLIIWQQIFKLADAFYQNVADVLEKTYFEGMEKCSRPFTVFGYQNYGTDYHNSWNGIEGENICGFSKVEVNNIGASRIEPHFWGGQNIAKDKQLQLALRSIEGLEIETLNENEKEQAAKAIECGYLYRDGGKLYTKILVHEEKDSDKLFTVTKGLYHGYFEELAEVVAEKLAKLMKKALPEHLQSEWQFANDLASLPILDTLIEVLIEKGILTPPENGIGAEGCWMGVTTFQVGVPRFKRAER